jgi:hypothetical protein
MTLTLHATREGDTVRFELATTAGVRVATGSAHLRASDA